MLHQVDVSQFEKLCQTLERRRVRCTTFPELMAGDDGASSILLTFDDGWSSVWSAAAPLAARYGVKFTLFLAPDCVEESKEVRTTLDTGATADEITRRDLGPRARLTWGEVLALQASGVVNIQSHSTHHGVVFRSATPKGFVTPTGPFPVNGLIPLVQRAPGGDIVSFKPEPGTPLFEWGPALTVKPRYLEALRLREQCIQVARDGGPEFFNRSDWRETLQALVAAAPVGEWESDEARTARWQADLEGSRRTIESRVPGTRVTVLAPPWAEVDTATPELARAAGYQLLVLGYPFHVERLDSSLPLYPRLFGDASWVTALGTLRGAPKWLYARNRALQRRRAGAIP
jgi:peptidoglycan/xylan/chitin deacetylase (PgdA/CDA1 family)